MSDWPKHPDGRNKKVGEMNQDERRVVFAAAAHRVKREFEQPHFQSAMQKILEASDPDLD